MAIGIHEGDGSAITFGATRQWQSSKLVDSEQQKVKEGNTTTYSTDGQAKSKSNGKTDYSVQETAYFRSHRLQDQSFCSDEHQLPLCYLRQDSFTEHRLGFFFSYFFDSTIPLTY